MALRWLMTRRAFGKGLGGSIKGLWCIPSGFNALRFLKGVVWVLN